MFFFSKFQSSNNLLFGKIVWRVGSKIEDEDRMLDLLIRNDASIASYITDTFTMRIKRGKDFFLINLWVRVCSV